MAALTIGGTDVVVELSLSEQLWGHVGEPSSPASLPRRIAVAVDDYAPITGRGSRLPTTTRVLPAGR